MLKGNEKVFRSEDCGLLLSSLVLVEDAISALKVGRVVNSCPLHKSIIPLELILRLSGEFKNLIVWLDKDKQKEVLAEAQKAKPYFDSVKIIWSDLDPKYYTTTEIKEFLK